MYYKYVLSMDAQNRIHDITVVTGTMLWGIVSTISIKSIHV